MYAMDSLNTSNTSGQRRRRRQKTAGILPVFKPSQISHMIDAYATAQKFYVLNGNSNIHSSFSEFMLHDVGRVGNMILTPDEDFGLEMYTANGWKYVPDIDYNFDIQFN